MMNKELIEFKDIDIDMDQISVKAGIKVAKWLLLLNAFVHYKPEYTIVWINRKIFRKVDNLHLPLSFSGCIQLHMIFQRNRCGCYIVFYNKQLKIIHQYFLPNNKKRVVLSTDLITVDTTNKGLPPPVEEEARMSNETNTREENNATVSTNEE